MYLGFLHIFIDRRHCSKIEIVPILLYGLSKPFNQLLMVYSRNEVNKFLIYFEHFERNYSFLLCPCSLHDHSSPRIHKIQLSLGVKVYQTKVPNRQRMILSPSFSCECGIVRRGFGSLVITNNDCSRDLIVQFGPQTGPVHARRKRRVVSRHPRRPDYHSSPQHALPHSADTAPCHTTCYMKTLS